MSTGQQIADRARDTLNDEDATAYRTSDTKLLSYINDFLLDAAILRPDLFSTVGNIACTQGRMVQRAPAGSIRILHVYQVVNGSHLTKVDFAYMDRHYGRRWRTAAQGTAIHWLEHETNPNEFYLFPQAPASQSVLAEWATNAASLPGLGSSLPAAISPMYDVAAHDYLVFRAESKDDEAVLGQRAELFLRKFAASMGVTMKQLDEAILRGTRMNPGQQKA